MRISIRFDRNNDSQERGTNAIDKVSPGCLDSSNENDDDETETSSLQYTSSLEYSDDEADDDVVFEHWC